MDLFPTILACAAAFALFPFVIGPILIYLKHRQLADPKFEVIPQENFPESVRMVYQDFTDQLKSAGFPHKICYKVTGVIPDGWAMVAMFPKESGHDIASIVSIFQKTAGSERAISPYVEFCGSHVSGLSLCTNSTPGLMPWPGLDFKIIHQFPKIRSVKDLYWIHARLLERLDDGSGLKLVPFVDRIASTFAESVREDMRFRLKQGILRYDEKEQAYRPTIKGAIMLTWGLAWPVTAIRRRLRSSRNRRLLEAIDFHRKSLVDR